MSRKIKSNRGLPSRVYFKSGSYFYVDKNNKWHNLGKTLHDMYRVLGTLLRDPYAEIYKMNDLFDRYMSEVAPNKSLVSYKHNIYQMIYIRGVFGSLFPGEIKPKDIYAYLDERGKDSIVMANREVALLSHVFTMAIKWGVVETNPCREVRKLKEQKRDRYVKDEEFVEIHALASPFVQNMMDLAYITGLRKGDILKIKLSDIKEEGVFVHMNKTKRKIMVEWTQELKDLIARIRNKNLSPKSKISGIYLFCTRNGDPYNTSGFDSIWQRLMRKAKNKEINIFRFHDIRRKAATDAEAQRGREYARQLLGHTNQQMTDTYISGTRRVKPIKTVSNKKI